MWFTILGIAAVVFLGYAIYSQYSATPADDPIPKRVWVSIVAAAGVIGAAATQWLHTTTAP